MTTPHAGTVLGGVRVVDCSDGIAGPLAAMLLADFGADVVKVEPPGGDLRRGEAGRVVWNRGKRSVPEASESLVRRADVLVMSSESQMDAGRARSMNGALVVLHTPPTLTAT